MAAEEKGGHLSNISFLNNTHTHNRLLILLIHSLQYLIVQPVRSLLQPFETRRISKDTQLKMLLMLEKEAVSGSSALLSLWCP